ncbi:MAG: hypothetical protein K2M05_04150 [Paramuribaculum sp.]|nr:hypothetical protein [Paramuribaculum sp.]
MPVYVTYTVNDTIAPSVISIGLGVYVDCVSVRVENDTLFLDFDLPQYMNEPGVNELQINITGPALTGIESDVKCMLVTIGDQTLKSAVRVVASERANILIRDCVTAPEISVSAGNGAVVGIFGVNTPLMNISASDLSIVNLYGLQDSSRADTLRLCAKGISTITVSDTIHKSLTEDKSEGSTITVQ